MKRVLIIGAGISGLSFAYYLQKTCDVSITILEKSAKVGGWLQTEKQGDFLYEKGPRFFAKHKSSHLLSLIKDLGLEEEIVFANASAKKRYLYTENHLHQVPTSLLSFFRSPLTKGTLGAFLQEPFQKRGKDPEETVEEFFFRRFRSKKILSLVQAMTNGIYAADIKNLSMKCSFPALSFLEKKYGSLLQGMMRAPRQDSRLFSLKNGVGTLTSILRKKIQADWQVSCSVEHIVGNKVFTNKGEWSADHIVLALPLSEVKKVFPHPSWQYLSTHSIHIVHLQMQEPSIKRQGFGYLNLENNSPILGAVFDSSMYPTNDGNERISVFLGGSQSPPLEKTQCHDLALTALRQHLDIEQTPENIAYSFGENAGVSYQKNHEKHLDTIVSALPKHLSLLGNYLEGISVDHCIQAALKKARSFHKKESSSPLSSWSSLGK